MSEFLNELSVRYASKKNGKTQWILLKPLTFVSTKHDFTITVPAGFVTDFASVPRLPLAYLVAGGIAQKPAVIHDWLYRKGIGSRSSADDIFYEAMGTAGVSNWRRYLMWMAVRLGGSTSWKGK